MRLPHRVAALSAGEPTHEQAAASDWAADRPRTAVDRVALADLAAGRADLADYDAVWWHRDRPLAWLGDDSTPGGARRDPDADDADADADAADAHPRDRVAAVAPSIREFLADGGGLLLSLQALAAVAPLGIDPVAPDASGTEAAARPSGYLAKAVYRDHPAFESFDDLAVRTRAAGAETAFCRYERVVPARGSVLAGAVHGDDIDVAQKPLVEWRVGDGRVVGAGVALAFADPRDYAYADAAGRLVGNLLTLLAGPADRRPTFTDRPTVASRTRDDVAEGADGSRDGDAAGGGTRDDATGDKVAGAGSGTRDDPGDAGFARVRRRLAGDPNRPAYHLAAPAGWLNDPNGLVQHDGRFHVFYQYNPAGPYHGSIHWGHAVSDDLLDWTDEPVALAPDPDGPDRDGCWSGCTVLDDGTPTLVYTGGRGREQLPCLATAADPDLRTWRKDPRNPVIAAPPADEPILETADWRAEFRDHCVRREGGSWYHLIGSGVRVDDAGGAAAGTVLVYRGTTLDDWTYVGRLLTGEPGTTAPVWECPELVDLGDASLLHVSDDDHVDYVLGDVDLDAPSFAVRSRGRLDHGDFYAPQSLRADDGRVLTWGWLPPARDAGAQWEAGWSGALSAPRELSVVDGRLRQRPARELAGLRDRRLAGGDGAGATVLADGDCRTVEPGSTAVEVGLRAERDPDAGATLEVGLFESPAGREATALRWEPGGDVVLDRSRASLDDRTSADEHRVPLDATADANADDPDDAGGGRARDALGCRLLLDGSIVEAFLDGREALTGRVYPTRRDATGLSVRAEGGTVRLARFDAWTLSGTFPAADGRERS